MTPVAKTPRRSGTRDRFAVGEAVEVVDFTHSLRGKTGTVVLFAGDNIYVEFPDLRWAPTKLLFAEQLRSLRGRKRPGGVAIFVHGVLRRFTRRPV